MFKVNENNGGKIWKIYFWFKLFKSEWYLGYIILYMGCKILWSYYMNNVIEIDGLVML